MRKPRIPCSAARRMSSTAYRSCRVPRSRPANTPPSADAAARPMSHSSRGPTNSETSMPLSAAIRASSASSASECSIAPLPWETRLTVTPRAAASSTMARSTSGPSQLGISIRKCAPSGNRTWLAGAAASAVRPHAASTPAPVSRWACDPSVTCRPPVQRGAAAAGHRQVRPASLARSVTRSSRPSPVTR